MTLKKQVENLEATINPVTADMPIELFEFDGKNYYDMHGNLANEAYELHCKKVSQYIEKFGVAKQISTLIVELNRG